MMARHLWTVLCHKAIVDREDNSTSLIQCIEDLVLLDEPPLPAENNGRPIVLDTPMQLVSYWERSDLESPEETYLRIRLVFPGGKSASHRQTMHVDLTSTERQRLIMRISGIPYHGPGRYEWTIEQETEPEKWSLVAIAPLMVLLEPDG